MVLPTSAVAPGVAANHRKRREEEVAVLATLVEPAGDEGAEHEADEVAAGEDGRPRDVLREVEQEGGCAEARAEGRVDEEDGERSGR